jgi:hypothetical protein
MDKLQIMNDSYGRIPKFRWHLSAPIVMATNGFAITRQIKGSAAFPTGVEDGSEAPSIAARPMVKS